MAIFIKTINRVLGAEASGVNLSSVLSEHEVAAILEAFDRHHVLLFRDQKMDAEGHERFAGLFGILEEVRTAPSDGARTKHVMYVANPVSYTHLTLPTILLV